MTRASKRPARRSSRPPADEDPPPGLLFRADDVMGAELARYAADVWQRFRAPRERIQAAQKAARKMEAWCLRKKR